VSIAASKRLFRRYRRALYDIDPGALSSTLNELVHPDCRIRLPHPLGDVTGADGLVESGYAPLLAAMPDLERRDYIVVGGRQNDECWIGCGGTYFGVFERPWLDIPATRHLAHLRYIEFFRIEDDRIAEMRLLWDIPSVMMQARAWPMGPSLGRELLVPGPALQDGILEGDSDPARSEKSLELVDAMVDGLHRFKVGGAGAMQLERYWHPKMTWYGPAGIGTNRRLSGFRNWHQIPFLKALPDRVGDREGSGFRCYFADGDYVAYCGWPALRATVSGDGWMGVAPSNQSIEMASLDLWRCENGRIRENWVMIDILDVWNQLGVDVFARMREVSFDRQPSDFQP
jgi:predicted ester cyclase